MLRKIILATTLLMEGCFLFPVVEPSDPYAKYTSEDQKEFVSVYNNHLKYYIYQDELSADLSSYQFDLKQFYSTLKDPYTRYYTPTEASALNQQMTHPEQKAVLGFSYQILHYGDSLSDSLQVTRVYPQGPAELMGLKKGDFLLKANGHSLIGDSALLLSTWIAGGEGTSVQFEVLRNAQILTLNGVKKVISIPTVFVDSVGPGISKVQLTGFVEQTLVQTQSDTSGTWAEFREALRQTSKDQATLIDLRSNPGGSVRQCLSIADEFVPEGGILIRYEDRGVSADTVTVLGSKQGLAENRKFVFLADSLSASCSEILLSAIRDNTSFKQVGTRTFGKGIGQGFYDTYMHGYTKITSLRFFNKDHIAYHGVGIAPTDLVYGDDAQLNRALQIASPGLMRPVNAGSKIKMGTDLQVQTQEGGAYLFHP